MSCYILPLQPPSSWGKEFPLITTRNHIARFSWGSALKNAFDIIWIVFLVSAVSNVCFLLLYSIVTF
eukprot:UN20395